MIKIKAIEASNGVLIKVEGNSYNSLASYYKINGEYAKETNHPNWFLIAKSITEITKPVSGQAINHRYELIDKSFENEKVKAVFTREEIAEYGYCEDSDYERWIFKAEFKHLQSLYVAKHDMTEPTLEVVPFEYEVIMSLDVLPNLKDFTFKGLSKYVYAFDRKVTQHITPKDVIHQELDKIIFPAPVLSERPCKLSSENSYNIIRAFVQDNIDKNWAKITSDYDFCFTVQKLIQLDEPVQYQYDVNKYSTRKRKPKYETRYRTHREVVIFEMTHEAKGYQNYTILKGFEGTSHENLKENIEKYLQDLIAKINEPLVDCSCCKSLRN